MNVRATPDDGHTQPPPESLRRQSWKLTSACKENDDVYQGAYRADGAGRTPFGAKPGAAVEAELTRLLAEGWLGPELASGEAVPSVRAENIRLNGDSPV